MRRDPIGRIILFRGVCAIDLAAGILFLLFTAWWAAHWDYGDSRSVPVWVFIVFIGVVVALRIGVKRWRSGGGDNDRRRGYSTLAAVLILGAIVAAFVAGYSAKGGDPNYLPSTKALPVGSVELTRSGSPSHGQFDSKLAELRDKPTLAVVTWFRLHPLTDRRQEVIEAMRAAADSEHRDVSQAAQVALIKWGM